MSLNVAPSAETFPVGTKPKLFAGALRATASLFQNTTPIEADTLVHRLWLVGLLFAGAAARFLGLAAVGLHGDEETMAMAVRGILEHGVPLLPSEMFYPRGMTQLYLMAGSVALFGESEWSLRLPSVLCGVALIAIAYWSGRRFLRPQWNLAFTAAVALLPALIDYSQTARMYIFLVALIMTSMGCVFEWERSGRSRWLAAAAAALVLGLDMHALAVAAILMFLMPGLLRADGRKLMLGGLAAFVVVIAYLVIDVWLSSHYPTPPTDFAAAFGPIQPSQSTVPRDFGLFLDVVLWSAGAAIALLAWRIGRRVDGSTASVFATLLLFAAIALQLAFYYHLAAIFYAAGVLIALRYGSTMRGRLGVLLAAVATLAGAHMILLAPESGTFLRLIGALTGQPSVWPYARIAQLSPAAGIATAVLLAFGMYRLAFRKPTTDYWLLALLGVWAPVFALGFFAWNVPPRYTAMSLAPMLMCAFAAAQHAFDWIAGVLARGHGRLSAPFAAVVALAMINPAGAVAAIGAGYGARPDHKGAAEFMRTQHITDDDVVLAEDVLQQTYYLGRVDYWLVGPQVARRFVKQTDAGVVDFYTGTPVVVTPAMLDKVLLQNQGKRVFIIGSGEDWRNGRRPVREDLSEAIQSNRFATVYLGRDGRTRVLRAVPTASASEPSVESTSVSEAQFDAELTGAAEQALDEAEAEAEAEQPAALESEGE